MRKLLVSACFALALLFSSVVAPTAQADHGYGGRGYGFGAPSCHGYSSGYGYRYGGYVPPYQTAIVPVYPGGIYQSYSFGGAPFGGYSNFGHIGSPFGGGYGAGFGGVNYGYGHRDTLPRVQLRIGF